MDPSKSAPTGDGLTEAKSKKKRRPHTPAVVRVVRTKVLSREEFELILSTLEAIAYQADSQQSPETGNGGPTRNGTQIEN